MQDIDPEGFERFVKDIANGLTDRIEVITDKDGAFIIIEGRNRALALERLGTKIDPDKHMAVKRFNSEAVLRAYIDSKNLHRRHLTKEWRDKILADLIKSNPERSDAAIADEATKKGAPTNKKKVNRARHEGERRGTFVPRQAVIDTKGRKQPAQKVVKVLNKKSPPPDDSMTVVDFCVEMLNGKIVKMAVGAALHFTYYKEDQLTRMLAKVKKEIDG